MNLLKAIGTIGGLTMVSRVLGFARDMIGSRVLGASHANDAFNVAFTLPNIFRRLFGEGAFASGFVPLFSRRLAAGGHEDAQRFSNEILAVFMPTLLVVTLIFEIAMPAFLWLIVSDYAATPGKFELAVELTRYTFPYLVFISLVAFLSGVLNSLTRFAIAAFAPALLNIALIVALLVMPGGGPETVRAMAIAVFAGGVLQFALCWIAVRQAGVKLHFGRPRLTPAVRELIVLIVPATAAAGVYQISQLFYTFFSSRLGEGALTNLGYADRLNQLPLSIIGTALGTAILPTISRSIERKADAEAANTQARAFDLAMLLTLPATLALAVAAGPIIAALFQGGRYSAEDAAITGNILAILAGSIIANFLLIPVMGIYSLATVTSVGAWLNMALLFAILAARGHFRLPGWLVGRMARQLVAAAAMAAVLYFLQQPLAGQFAASAGRRILAVGALVSAGGVVYFGLAWIIGGIDRNDFKTLFRRAKPEEAPIEDGAK